MLRFFFRVQVVVRVKERVKISDLFRVLQLGLSLGETENRRSLSDLGKV